MSFFLKERVLIRGAKAHVEAGLGPAADYKAKPDTNLYAPFDGIISIPFFANLFWKVNEGGKWIQLLRPNGDKLQWAHNNEWLVKNGPVKRGALIAKTGNTGKITTGPHSHIQIRNKVGAWLDPEAYNWDTPVDSLEAVRQSINDVFRATFGRFPTVKENSYYLARVHPGDITTSAELQNKMNYWKSLGKTMGK